MSQHNQSGSYTSQFLRSPSPARQPPSRSQSPSNYSVDALARPFSSISLNKPLPLPSSIPQPSQSSMYSMPPASPSYQSQAPSPQAQAQYEQSTFSPPPTAVSHLSQTGVPISGSQLTIASSRPASSPVHYRPLPVPAPQSQPQPQPPQAEVRVSQMLKSVCLMSM